MMLSLNDALASERMGVKRGLKSGFITERSVDRSSNSSEDTSRQISGWWTGAEQPAYVGIVLSCHLTFSQRIFTLGISMKRHVQKQRAF